MNKFSACIIAIFTKSKKYFSCKFWKNSQIAVHIIIISFGRKFLYGDSYKKIQFTGSGSTASAVVKIPKNFENFKFIVCLLHDVK